MATAALKQDFLKRAAIAAGVDLTPKSEPVQISLAEFFRESWSVLEPSTDLLWNWHLEAICFHVQEVFFDWLRSRTDPDYQPRSPNLIVNVPPGSAKPVYNRSMIYEQVKGYIPISEVVVGDRVLTHKGRFRQVLAVHHQGVLPLLQVTTNSGRVLKLAYDHPVLTTRGWIEAGNLTESDVVANIHPQEDGGKATISIQCARALGYLVGDGCTSQGQAATFTNQDPETVQDFIECIDSIGFRTVVKKRPGKNTHTNLISVCDATRGNYRNGSVGEVRSWVRTHGLEKKTSYTKTVPAAIASGNSEVVAEFLAAYWACDGGIENRRDVPRVGRDNQLVNSVRISCVTVSEELARGLQRLLNKLGLKFNLRKKVHNYKSKKQGDNYTSWMLTASSQDVAAKFMHVIGSRIRHEKSKRAQGLRRTDFDSVLNPDSIKEIKAIDPGECMCLTVEEDESFTIEDIAVHNSRIVSVCAPAWIWTYHPGFKMIFLSANPRVALRDSVLCRDLIESQWYQERFKPSWQLRLDQNAKSSYWNSAGGFRNAGGFNSRITGDRADGLFVDDPHDAEEVNSDTKRLNVIERWDTAIYNRVNDTQRSFRIGIMQRLHEEDWAGHNLKTGEWGHLCIPQEWEGDRTPTPFDWTDPRTEPGQLMFPDRFSREFVDKEKKRLGSYGYAGQHQQRPAPMTGGLFKRSWWQYYEVLPAFEQMVQSWDCTFKDAKTSDYVVGQVWGRRGSEYYLLDQIRDRLDINGTLAAIEQMTAKWPQAKAKLIEDKANGSAVIDLLKRKISGLIAINPNGGKVVRAQAIAPYVEAGNVYLPHYPWVGDFVGEFSQFPNGANDDQVDCTSQAIAWMEANKITPRASYAVPKTFRNPFV